RILVANSPTQVPAGDENSGLAEDIRLQVELLVGGPVSLYSSPRAARALMRSAVRRAMAWMVSEGLTPPTVGNTEPSQTHRFAMSQLRQSALTTLVRGSSPMRAVPLR